MKIAIIIPTYNEAKTIASLIEALEEECRRISRHAVTVLVVDGNSPDGTAGQVRLMMKKYGNLRLVSEREKSGLGCAYIAGITYAVRELQADAYIEFDGDFQHDPKDVARLIQEFENGYDYVIGSRYVAGGSVPREWSWHRKLLSKYGSRFIKIMLSLPTDDNTSGLKLSRVKGFAEKLPLDPKQILSKRHAYKIHFLWEMVKLGARVKEIPIAFLPRKSGDSKSTFEDIIESLRVVAKLKRR